MSGVAAIVLAAGGSTRLGRPKQLVTFGGETLVRRAINAAAAGGCAPVVVVVGETESLIRRELSGSSAEFVVNVDWQRGLGTSIRCGMEQLLARERNPAAVILVACDQPFVDAALIATLRATHESTGNPIVACRYAGTLGIPAVFDASCFGELLSLPDDSGAKAIISANADRVAEVPFAAGEFDIDTAADLERLNASL